MNVETDLIRIDGQTQSRVTIDDATVSEYVDAILSGATMPPLDVFYDGTHYWLADGFHRLLAFLRANAKEVACKVVKGSKEDAAWASAGANVTHGLRRTNADKHKAVQIALALKPELSDRELANHCGVSHTFVASVRPQLATVASCPTPQTRTGADGRTRRVPPQRPPRPPAPPQSSPPCQPRAAPKATPAALPKVLDAKGKEIPEENLAVWHRRHEVAALVKQVADIRNLLADAQERGDKVFANLQYEIVLAELTNARSHLKAAIPHVLCPTCQGIARKCRLCNDSGFVGEYVAKRIK